jgi:hypothetical protein
MFRRILKLLIATYRIKYELTGGKKGGDEEHRLMHCMQAYICCLVYGIRMQDQQTRLILRTYGVK